MEVARRPEPHGPFTLSSIGFSVEVLATAPTEAGLVAWLRAGPIARPLCGPSIGEALIVTETGSVGRLSVENRSPVPVLVPADWILDGGKQARVVERSAIVSPGASSVLRVRCVEQHRWSFHKVPSARAGHSDETRFAMRGSSTLRTRAHFADSRARSFRRGGAHDLDQASVWAHVEDELTRTSTRSRTSSYVDYLDASRASSARLTELIMGMPAEANGMAVLSARESWLEVLPTPADLKMSAVGTLTGALDFARAAGEGGSPTGEVSGARARQPDEVSRLVAELTTKTWTRLPLVEERGAVSLALEDAPAYGAALLWENEIAHLVLVARSA